MSRFPRHSRSLRLLLGISLLQGVLLAQGGAITGDAELLFVRRIAPLLQEKCLACHGRDEGKLKGSYDLRTAASAFMGGESGEPAIVSGKPDQSPLYLAVTRQHADTWEPMPPKEADRLDAEQTGWLRDWIAGGAPWPDETRMRAISTQHQERWSAEDGRSIATSGGLSAEWTSRRYKPEGIWAYQPLQEHTPPGLAEHPIDAFLAAKLSPGLSPAPAADPRLFIRRATFDLLGLPPSPEEIAAFVRDAGGDPDGAVQRLIDRLLASPHYGERMAQHWLDVTRYSDSSGFANDYERGNAWRYRDYIVRSFNADKPYDRFVREQIAGDELAPADPEMLVATGFLRMGPWELTGMEVARVARQRFLDDVVNSVGETFLAQSLQCARCHDHKFDPVPTRDFYAIQAVFATTQLAERPAPFLPAENTAGFEEKRYLETSFAEHLSTLRMLDERQLENAGRWFAAQGLDRASWDAAVAAARATTAATATKEGGKRRRVFEGIFENARLALQRQGVAEHLYPPKLVGFTPEEYGRERVARKGLERLRWELERYEPFAFSVYNGRTPLLTAVYQPLRIPPDRLTRGEWDETCIRTGGDPFATGEKVQPGVLSVVAGRAALPLTGDIEGRRRAFAEWVAQAENPLTTRAIVNRIWLWHFGQPIAANPNNFGSTGGRPTHPELLDWLAARFVRDGWSFKAMHRLIMTSAAYRRGTEHPDRKLLAAKDPAGTSYACFRPRRLTAEELRDAMLLVTGELNPTLGGIPNRPEINLEAALQPRQVMGTFAAAWVPNPRPEQRHRRSLYALKLRGLSDPMLEVFNAPAPDFSCERREASTVTPQVFSLFNGQASHARALALAARAIRETATDESAIDRCFQLALGRSPRAEERESCLRHWREIVPLAGETVVTLPRPPLEVRREAVEENTGERFVFLEKLHACRDFIPDLQPAEVPPRTRALADVCLVLLNANEFAYVY